MIKKYQQKACLSEAVTPQMFRHTTATLLLENGVDIQNIQIMLGHSSLSVTEIYPHVNQSPQREAFGRGHPRQYFQMEECIPKKPLFVDRHTKNSTQMPQMWICIEK
jgi:integrase/recombinase XerD